MDIQQLKLLAARIRGLLQQSQCSLGHNLSLDITASLVGLRNWPEVLAFPDRVSAGLLDKAATDRLGFRIKRKFGLQFDHEQLISVLAPDTRAQAHLPQIWPGGPRSGVYVTAEGDAIDALLARFEEETDGALIYAEEAAAWRDGTINLGDNGLWSAGLDRVPTGTLIVVGPLQLNQNEWEESVTHFQMACTVAGAYGHRVAVLLATPTPNRVFEDAYLMAQLTKDEQRGAEQDLVGIVSLDGELLPRDSAIDIGANSDINKARRHRPDVTAIPESARSLMEPILRSHREGVVMLGTGKIDENSAIKLIESTLAMTEHVGPAARIMPRKRGTPAKYWQVPDAIKELPFLASIDSAYAQGFRRMMVYANYTEAKWMLKYPDVLFIGGCWGSQVTDVVIGGSRAGYHEEHALIKNLLAVLALTPLKADRDSRSIIDLYLRNDRMTYPIDYAEAIAELEMQRAMKWEDQVAELLKSTPSKQLRESFDDDRMMQRVLNNFLADETLEAEEIPADTDAEVIEAAKQRLLQRASRGQRNGSHDHLNDVGDKSSVSGEQTSFLRTHG